MGPVLLINAANRPLAANDNVLSVMGNEINTGFAGVGLD